MTKLNILWREDNENKELMKLLKFSKEINMELLLELIRISLGVIWGEKGTEGSRRFLKRRCSKAPNMIKISLYSFLAQYRGWT